MTSPDPEPGDRLARSFDELCDLPREYRTARLGELAAQDPELGATLAELVREFETYERLAETSLREDPDILLGTNLEGYVLEEVIGRGGMGVVYRAAHPNAGQAAIKLTNERIVEPELRARHEREVDALARIGFHPNIVGIRAAGQDPVGRHYLIMDFVEGQSLASPASLAHLGTLRQCVDVLIQIADTVFTLGQKGFVHRDLTPANIVLTRVGDRMVPVVLDLGIARDFGREIVAGEIDDSPSDSAGTITTTEVGTRGYMSPEQKQLGAPIDQRSDIYGLGALAYWLVTGEHPALKVDDIVPPSERVSRSRYGAGAGKRARDLSGDLDAVVMRALAPDPAQRYDTAKELATDLRNWVARRPVLARPRGRIGNAIALVRRHPLVATLATSLVLVLAGVALWSSVRLARETELRRGYQDQVALAESAAELLFRRMLRKIMPGHLGPQVSAVDLLGSLEGELVEMCKKKRAIPFVCMSGSYLVQAFDQLGDTERCDAILSAIGPEADSLPPSNLQRIRFELARAAILMARDEITEEGLAREAARMKTVWGVVRRLRLEFPTPDREERLQSVRIAVVQMLGSIAISRGKHVEARKWLLETLALPNIRPIAAAMTLSELAVTNQKLGDSDQAIRRAREAIAALASEKTPMYNGVRASLYSNLAFMLLAFGKAEQALPAATRAVEIGNAHHPDLTHPNHLRAVLVKGRALVALSRFAEAVPLLVDNVAMRKKRYGDKNPQVIEAMLYAAEARIGAGNVDSARALLGEATALRSESEVPEEEYGDHVRRLNAKLDALLGSKPAKR